MGKIISIVFLWFAAFNSYAQFFIPHLGATLNHNTQSITSSSDGTVYNAKGRVGFMAGFGLNARMGDHMSFQPEFYYLQRNFVLDFQDVIVIPGPPQSTNTIKSHDSYRIGYLEIPLLLKYKFLQGKMFFTFGPYVSIGLGGAHSYNYLKTFSGQAIPSSGHDRITFGPGASGVNDNRSFDRRTDVGIQPGIGGVVFKKWTLEARWDIGAKNLLKARSSRNETIVVMVSYPISFVPEDE